MSFIAVSMSCGSDSMALDQIISSVRVVVSDS